MDGSSSSQAYGYASQSQSNSQRARKRKNRCTQCGSARFRRDPSTSLVVCEFGHVLQGFRDEEAQDGDDFSTTRVQMSRRNLKVQGRDRSGKRARKKRSVATTGVWHGSRSRFLFFQVLQLILRLQVKALLREMPGLPEEIEPICRDLWALYVSQRQDLIAQPYTELSGQIDENLDSLSNVKPGYLSSQAGQLDTERNLIIAQEEEEESEEIRDRLFEEGLTEYEEVTQSIKATSSDWESAAETSVDDAEGKVDFDTFAPKKRSRKGRRKRRMDMEEGKNLKRHNRNRLDDLLSILHLALVTLRIPIIWNDLCLLIKAGRLPFFNVVAHLPAEMVAPLPAREVRGLDPNRLPSIRTLHHQTVALSIDFYDRYGLEFPELNSLPILLRFVEQLLLPPTFYSASKSLLTYLAVPMHTVPMNSSAIPHKTQVETENGRPKLDPRLNVTLGKRSTAREIIIVAAIVLVIKLRYGLDGDERYEEFEEPTLWSGAPPLPSLLNALDASEKNVQYDVRSVYDPQGVDLLDMNDELLDAYLSYAERMLILNQNPRAHQWRRREGIQDLMSCAPHLDNEYPLKKEISNDQHDQLAYPKKHITASIEHLYKGDSTSIPPSLLLSSGHLRPGDAYSVYRSDLNELQSLHLDYRRVLHHAARLVGAKQEDLADTVHSLEIALIKLLLWKRKVREANEKQKLRESQGKRKPGRPRKEERVAALENSNEEAEDVANGYTSGSSTA